MIMDLDQILISYCKQTVTFKILCKIITDHIFIEILSLDQKLCIISEL